MQRTKNIEKDQIWKIYGTGHKTHHRAVTFKARQRGAGVWGQKETWNGPVHTRSIRQREQKQFHGECVVFSTHGTGLAIHTALYFLWKKMNHTRKLTKMDHRPMCKG